MTKTVVGPNARAFLLHCGYEPNEVAAFSGSTRLFHDMNLSGDNAHDEFCILASKFDVDLTSFPFDKYFPHEFVWWAGIFLHIFRTSKWAGKKRDRYAPLTLDMIEQAIISKRWIFD